LGLQAGSNMDGNLETMKRLMEDEACYNAKNPNNNYSVRLCFVIFSRALPPSLNPAILQSSNLPVLSFTTFAYHHHHSPQP
ncbi:MAG: hypothetical protein ABGY24_03645, partial [bacterium]